MAHQTRIQIIENAGPLTRSSLAKSVSRTHGWPDAKASLYAPNGERKYLNRAERLRALSAMRRLEPLYSLYARLLAWTGARPSEVLNLRASSIDIETGIVHIVTLKRRAHFVRGVPIPPDLMKELARHFRLQRVQTDGPIGAERLFRFSRITAWRIIKRVMAWAAIGGIKASPKGLRHAFGVGALQSGVPITLVQRWMGHARLATTAIYLNVSGPDELLFARWFWNGARQRPAGPTVPPYAMAA